MKNGVFLFVCLFPLHFIIIILTLIIIPTLQFLQHILYQSCFHPYSFKLPEKRSFLFPTLPLPPLLRLPLILWYKSFLFLEHPLPLIAFASPSPYPLLSSHPLPPTDLTILTFSVSEASFSSIFASSSPYHILLPYPFPTSDLLVQTY